MRNYVSGAKSNSGSSVSLSTPDKKLSNNESLSSQAKAENHTGLSEQLKTGLETLSGFDLSDVRVHRNSSRPNQINAHAYTQGTDIHLGHGQEEHLPHEAWHVIQQMQGRVKPTLFEHGVSINDETSLESEADVMGQRALSTNLSGSPQNTFAPTSTTIGSNFSILTQRQEETSNPCENASTATATSLVAVGHEQRARTFGHRLNSRDRRVWSSLTPSCRSGWSACSERERSSIGALSAPRINRRNRTAQEKHERLDRLEGRIHAAMDVSAARDTSVFAPIDGVVSVSQENPNLYGNYVMLLHQCPPNTEDFGTSPLVSLYAHLESRSVSAGDNVSAGSALGKVGDSGVPGRVHLHFSVRHLNRRFGPDVASSRAEENRGLRINPVDWLAAMGITVGPVDVRAEGERTNHAPRQASPEQPVQQKSNSQAPRTVANKLKKPIQRQAVIQRITNEERFVNTLTNAGTTRAAWIANYTTGTFLGRTVRRGLHQELANRLTLAETSLQADFPTLTLTQIGDNIGLDTITGRRILTSAVGGTTLSYHSYGLAIDVNYTANPFIGRSVGSDTVINDIHLYMTGNEFHLRGAQTGTVEEIRSRYEAASAQFARYFGMRGDNDLIRAFLAERGEVAGSTHPDLVNPWQVEDDAKVLALSNQIELHALNADLLSDMQMTGGAQRALSSGFTDLTTELVSSLTGAAGLYWGGEYRTGKDLMHFDWRQGTVRNRHRE